MTPVTCYYLLDRRTHGPRQATANMAYQPPPAPCLLPSYNHTIEHRKSDDASVFTVVCLFCITIYGIVNNTSGDFAASPTFGLACLMPTWLDTLSLNWRHRRVGFVDSYFVCCCVCEVVQLVNISHWRCVFNFSFAIDYIIYFNPEYICGVIYDTLCLYRVCIRLHCSWWLSSLSYRYWLLWAERRRFTGFKEYRTPTVRLNLQVNSIIVCDFFSYVGRVVLSTTTYSIYLLFIHMSVGDYLLTYLPGINTRVHMDSYILRILSMC